MGPALCVLLVVLAASESPLSLEGQAGLGAGYDGNVTLAPRGEPTTGSPVVAGWAGLGLGWEPGERTYLSAGLRYDGTFLTAASDLSRNLAGVDLLWIQEVGDVVALIVGAGGAWSWYLDDARDGPGVAARVTLRVRPLDWLVLRAGYAYAQRWASVDVYSTLTHRVFGSAEAKVARGVYVGIAYAWQTGIQTFYVTVPVAAPAAPPGQVAVLRDGPGASAGGPGTGGTGPGGAGTPGGGPSQGTGVFANLVPYQASTADSTLTPTFEATVWEGLYLYATYSYTWGTSVEGSYVVQSGMGGAGYRF